MPLTSIITVPTGFLVGTAKVCVSLLRVEVIFCQRRVVLARTMLVPIQMLDKKKVVRFNACTLALILPRAVCHAIHSQASDELLQLNSDVSLFVFQLQPIHLRSTAN